MSTTTDMMKKFLKFPQKIQKELIKFCEGEHQFDPLETIFEGYCGRYKSWQEIAKERPCLDEEGEEISFKNEEEYQYELGPSKTLLLVDNENKVYFFEWEPNKDFYKRQF